MSRGTLPGKRAKTPVLAAFVQCEEIQGSENTFRILGGMGSGAEQNEVMLALHTIPLSQKKNLHLPAHQPSVLRSGKIDGIILVNAFEIETAQALAARVPCVSIDILYPEVHLDYVGEENFETIGKIIGHLHGLGHRRIGYIDQIYEMSVNRERLGGYTMGLMQAGLAFNPGHVLRAQDRLAAPDKSGLEVLHRWIREGVTAVTCMNDLVAFEVYRWLRDHGYRCPDQISVTGFDALPLPVDIPPVTTVKVHFQDLGRLAVERLLLRLREPSLPSIRVTVDCELALGKTTGPAPVR